MYTYDRIQVIRGVQFVLNIMLGDNGMYLFPKFSSTICLLLGKLSFIF